MTTLIPSPNLYHALLQLSQLLEPHGRSMRHVGRVFIAALRRCPSIMPRQLLVARALELRRATTGSVVVSVQRSAVKDEIHVSRKYYPNDAIETFLSAQPSRYDYRSIRGQRSFGSMLGHPITAEVQSLSMWAGRQVENPSDHDEREKAFLSLVVWQADRCIMISTVVRRGILAVG